MITTLFTVFSFNGYILRLFLLRQINDFFFSGVYTEC